MGAIELTRVPSGPVTPVYKRPILGTEKHMAEIIYNLELVFKERDFRLLN